MTDTRIAAGAADSADPSMEDILASIRRILNEEQLSEAPRASEEPPVDNGVPVLDQSMMVSADEPEPEGAEPDRESPDGPLGLGVEPPHQEREVAMPTSSPGAPPEPLGMAGGPAGLVAPEAAAAAASSVSSLMRTLAASRATQVYSGGPTLEDMVRAEMRPLLKEWLDVFLPPMVERLVRAEIERVVGRVVPLIERAVP